MSSNAFEFLKKNTTIVADTGDIELIRQLQPQDATTNPSLLLQVASKEQYAPIVDSVIAKVRANEKIPAEQKVAYAMDLILVTFGAEISKLIAGRVSLEVDCRLSYDTEGTVAKARAVIAMCEAVGLTKDRVLIKIASTWEGIKAAEILEKEGINCNLTLLFSKAQAIACAEAGAYLISPFVGRILDFYKAQGKSYPNPAEDPGVVFVSEVWKYYKTYGFETVVMGASFRNIDEIMELNGCDRLTIGPALINQLKEKQVDALEQKLDIKNIVKAERVTPMTEKEFRWNHAADPMANEKLANGITAFAADTLKLEKIIADKLAQ